LWESRRAPDTSVLLTYEAGEVENALRKEMVQKLHRGCEHALVFGAVGVCSTRVDETSFLITPDGMDNDLLEENDLVFVKSGEIKAGKHPAKELALHAAIYDKHPEINAIFSATPAHVAAYASANQRFETSTDEFISSPDTAASRFSEKTPVVLFENARIVTTGNSLFTALDRLEVAEATAASILTAQDAGKVILLNDTEIQALKTTFHLD